MSKLKMTSVLLYSVALLFCQFSNQEGIDIGPGPTYSFEVVKIDDGPGPTYSPAFVSIDDGPGPTFVVKNNA